MQRWGRRGDEEAKQRRRRVEKMYSSSDVSRRERHGLGIRNDSKTN